MPDTAFDPADAGCWIAHGRRPEHAAMIAAAWGDFPDLPPSAPLAERMARSRARIAAMNPVNEQIRLDRVREQEATNFAFTQNQIRQGRGSTQDAVILAGHERYGYDWLRSVYYGQGWYAAQAGWDFPPPGPDLRGKVSDESRHAYATGFADGGGRRDDLFDTARRQFAAAGRAAAAVPVSASPGRPLPSEWPQPRDAHRSVAWNRRLVILAATAVRTDAASAPAIDLLDDPVAAAIRATAGIAQARVIVLSSPHGFIDGQARRSPWVEAMTQERAAELCASTETRAQLVALLRGHEIDDILVAAQNDYLRIVNAHAAVLPLCRVMERTRNTPLQQRAHVGIWLARGRDAGENVGAGHIRWSKLIQGLTGKLGEFTARYGGPATPRGHRIVIEVTPGILATGYVTAAGLPLAPEVVISNKAHLRVEMARMLRSFAAATRLVMVA